MLNTVLTFCFEAVVAGDHLMSYTDGAFAIKPFQAPHTNRILLFQPTTTKPSPSKKPIALRMAYLRKSPSC